MTPEPHLESCGRYRPSAEVESTRRARSAVPLHPLLAQRWSPRGFDTQHRLGDAQVQALLEAARWAPSASNSQPWRFLVALRGTPDHARVFHVLAPGNRKWAGAASALIVAAAVAESAELKWAEYDTGQAVAHMTLQAEHIGLSVHQLGGFDAAALAGMVEERAGRAVRPLVVVAVGRLDRNAALEEPFATREAAARERRPLDELTMRMTAPRPSPREDGDEGH